MRKLKAFILSFLVLFGLWLVLGGVHRDELITGLVVALILWLLFRKRLEFLGDFHLSPKSVFCILCYVAVFLWELFKSAIDVAKRVISPRLPINPGIVKVRSKLKSPIGRIILANSITLTPGTMTVEMDEEYYYIHWIDIQSDDIEGATKAIVSTFERHLEVFFG